MAIADERSCVWGVDEVNGTNDERWKKKKLLVKQKGKQKLAGPWTKTQVGNFGHMKSKRWDRVKP